MGAIAAEVVETGERRGASGRRMTPAARRAELVEAFGRSGVTMATFARREGIKYPTFVAWVAKTQRSAAPKSAIKFAEVRVPALATARESLPLEVRLPDGTVLRGGRASELAELVRALRA